jgi:hypothetical protein
MTTSLARRPDLNGPLVYSSAVLGGWDDPRLREHVAGGMLTLA